MMKYLRIVLMVIILASFAFFVRATDLEKVRASMEQVGWNFLWILVTTTLAYLLGAIGWKCCMGDAGKNLSLLDLFLIRHIGETVSVINPTSVVGGEALKVFLLKDKGIERKTVIHSVLLSRIIMVLTQILLFFGVAVYMLAREVRFNWEIRPVQWLLPVGLMLVFLGLLRQNWIRQAFWATRPGKWLDVRTGEMRVKIKEMWKDLLDFSRNNSKNLALSCFYFTFHWVFGAAEFFVILHFLHLPISMVQAVFIDMGVVFFKAAGAMIPGQIGVEEYGNKVMLAAVGVAGTEIWITVSVLRRSRQLCWTVFGLITYFIFYKNVGKTVVEN
ncbi:MAG: flippase-like domain-containing protein [Bacteroidetes bacterium]|nr:flippase-like domain-containing protein [Bacteroidota bacterium]